jgi:hypothetical protein
MINQDILAYVILGVVYIFAVLPIWGSIVSCHYGSKYLEDFKVGAIIHGLIILIATVLFSILWALNRVGWL